MILTEELLSFVAKQVLEDLTFSYQGTTINLTPPWTRLSMKEGIVKYSDIPLVMLFTDARSIREVILFSQLRKENLSKSVNNT